MDLVVFIADVSVRDYLLIIIWLFMSYEPCFFVQDFHSGDEVLMPLLRDIFLPRDQVALHFLPSGIGNGYLVTAPKPFPAASWRSDSRA